MTFAGENSENFRVKNSVIVDDTDAAGNQGDNFAYSFTFERIASGIPILAFDDVGIGTNNEAYSFEWRYESLNIKVDNDGLAEVAWYAPITVGKTIEENAALLPFDQILKSYGSMMKAKYEPIVKEVMQGKITFEMTAREAQLVLLRIREQ